MRYKVLASFHFTLAVFQGILFSVQTFVTGPKFVKMFTDLKITQTFWQVNFVWIVFALALGNLVFAYLNLSSKVINKDNVFAIGLSYMFISLFIVVGLMVYGSILPVYQITNSL